MTNTQLFHFILSFNERTLRTWYNEVMVDPFGDFREQTIRDYTEEEEEKLKKDVSLEVLCEIMRNEKTNFVSDNLYFAVTGGDQPYLISFDTFEEFLNLSEKDAFLEYLQTYPEHIDTLVEMSKNNK